MSLRKTIMPLCVALLGLSAVAQSATVVPPILSIPKITQAPKIDGIIDESEWANAAVADGYMNLSIKDSPREKTRAWASYDAKNVYLAFRCWMMPGVNPRAEITKRDDAVYTDDAVEVFIAPDRGGADFQFAGNSVGAMYDAAASSSDFNADWQYAARRTDFGWEGEMAIPFAALSLPEPKIGEAWGVLLGRDVQNPTQLYSQWSYMTTYWHEPKIYGTFVFAGDTPRIVVDELNARGLAVSLTARAVAPKESSANLTINTTLRQILRAAKGADSMAMVAVFDEADGSIIAQKEEKIALNAGQSKLLDLPAIPSTVGSYTMQIDAKDDRGTLIFSQKIPLDMIKPMAADIRRLPTAGVCEIAVDLSPSNHKGDVSKVLASICQKNGDVIWKSESDREGQFKFLGYGKLKAGSYILKLQAIDVGGKVLYADELPLPKEKTPKWYANKLGKEDTVIAPWTPVGVSSGNAIDIWGRRYTFDSIGLPSRITTGGYDLLSDGAALETAYGAKPGKFVADGSLKIKRTDTKAIVTSSSHLDINPAIKLVAKTTVEFDGFSYTELTLSGSNGAVLDNLRLVFPIKAVYAKYHLPVFNDPVSTPASGIDAPVIPITDWQSLATNGLYWTGDEERGLAISAEDDRNWRPADAAKAISLKPSDNGWAWTLHFADLPLEISKPVNLSFCWQATPAKPVDKWYASRVVGDGWFKNYEKIQLDPSKPPVSQSQVAFDEGIRVMHIHEPWTEIMSYPGTFQNEKDVRANQAEANRVGLKYALYSQNNISSLAPEYAEWGNEFSLSIPMQSMFSRTPPQSVYGACKGSSWSDFYIWNWVRMIKEWGVNGMYLDGTYGPAGCTNPYHDHVYCDAQGKIHPTQPIREAREFMKRYVRAAKAADPSFFLLGHGQMPFVGHFMDYSMTGENFWFAPANFEIPLDYVRVALSRQWGTPMDFYRGPILAQDYIQPIALANGISTWTSGIGAETAQWKEPVWRIWEKFDVEHAVFTPYWKHSKNVTTSNPDVIASYYTRGKNVLLATATNKRTKSDAIVSVDLKALGLNPSAVTVTTGEGTPIDAKPDPDGILRLKFPTQTNAGLYVWIKE